MSRKNNAVSVIPLGGLGEIGKNMWIIETARDIVVIDAGVMFPEEDMLGVDLVIPDISYLIEKRKKVRAIILTHGHEDHIGALPYVLRELSVPVYGTRLTLGLVRSRLQEHGLLRNAKLHEVKAGDRLRIGGLGFELVHVNHSIPDVVALAINTPAGTMVFATDFKFDQTPIDGKPTDVQRLGEIGSKGVIALFSDSTNAERPGYTLSEKVVGDGFMTTFRNAKGRVVVATFASNVHRVQQVFDAALAVGRKVCVIGRSMINVVRIASELGYLHFPEEMLIEVSEVDKHSPDEVVILSTGSQGEPMAALSRMAASEHRQMEIAAGDTVIISAHAIPGNERLVGRTINQLYKLGAEVIYDDRGVHVSGHASQEELKWMLNLVRPKYFVPIHGEYRMLFQHAQLAHEVGIPEDNTFVLDIGDTLQFSRQGEARLAGRVSSGQVFVDGLGVGDVGNIVLRDRRQLSQDGILVAVVTIDKNTGKILSGPDIVSRGFVYIRESEALLDEARVRLRKAITQVNGRKPPQWNVLRNTMRDALSRFLYEQTKRRPIILPVVMEV